VTERTRSTTFVRHILHKIFHRTEDFADGLRKFCRTGGNQRKGRHRMAAQEEPSYGYYCGLLVPAAGLGAGVDVVPAGLGAAVPPGLDAGGATPDWAL